MVLAYTVKWGILATGAISDRFTADLVLDAVSRDEGRLHHEVVAIGSSSGVEKAKKFAEKHNLPDAKTYGNYDDLVADKNIQVLYIGSPHSHHYENVNMALDAGLNVLCEKAFTINTQQAEKLVTKAREKKLFLMEAFWSRFFPASRKLHEILVNGDIGEIKEVTSDLSLQIVDKDTPNTSRLIDPKLGGGALLDLGVYPIHWLFQILYQTIPVGTRKAPTKTTCTLERYGPYNVDNNISGTLTFPHGAVGHFTADMTKDGSKDTPATLITGTKGKISVDRIAPKPLRFTVEIEGKDKQVYDFPLPDGVNGLGYEADEVARLLRDGKTESEDMTLEESIEVMKVCDEIRKLNDVKFPMEIERV